MPSPLLAAPWYAQAIDIMLVEHLDLLHAASVLGIPLTPEECVRHKRCKAFRDMYSQMSRRYYQDQSSTSDHTKSILVGKMLALVEQLVAAGRLADAEEALFKVAKIEGWVGSETTTNIFATLSGADFAKIREQIAAKQAQQAEANHGSAAGAPDAS